MKEYFYKVKKKEIEKIITGLTKMMENIHRLNSNLRVYDNKMIREKLCISENVLAYYRKEGLLPYSRYGDKYWYTQKDIEDFIYKTKVYIYEKR